MIHIQIYVELKIGDKVLTCYKKDTIEFMPFLGLPFIDKELCEACGIWEKRYGFFVAAVEWLSSDGSNCFEVCLDLLEEAGESIQEIDVDEAAAKLNESSYWEAQVLS